LTCLTVFVLLFFLRLRFRIALGYICWSPLARSLPRLRPRRLLRARIVVVVALGVRVPDLGFGRIVASEIEAPNTLENLV
jgi:hypothetical protein